MKGENDIKTQTNNNRNAQGRQTQRKKERQKERKHKEIKQYIKSVRGEGKPKETMNTAKQK
jgi:hypothetical protein